MVKPGTYSVLIPAYEAEPYLDKLLDQIRKVIPPPEEIFIVDDGSSDNTSYLANGFGAVVIRHQKNQGKGAALKSGFSWFMTNSVSEYLICMDADLQHFPGEIPKFLQFARKENLFFVIGNRLNRMKNMPVHRKISNKTTSFILSRMTGQTLKDSQCGYRLLHRDIIQDLELYENGFQMESEAILKAAERRIKIGFVDIESVYEQEASHMHHVADTFKFVALIGKSIINRIRWFTRKNKKN